MALRPYQIQSKFVQQFSSLIVRTDRPTGSAQNAFISSTSCKERTIRKNLFVVYLMALSVDQTIWCQIINE
jgi:hypothetical protein